MTSCLRGMIIPFCRNVDHGSKTDSKPRRKVRLANLAFRTKRDSGRLRGERTGENLEGALHESSDEP